jgi:hypothetical protein
MIRASFRGAPMLVCVVQCSLSFRRSCSHTNTLSTNLSPPQDVAQATGVLLDPVYSGKAVAAMMAEMRGDPDTWAGRRCVHA